MPMRQGHRLVPGQAGQQRQVRGQRLGDQVGMARAADTVGHQAGDRQFLAGVLQSGGHGGRGLGHAPAVQHQGHGQTEFGGEVRA